MPAAPSSWSQRLEPVLVDVRLEVVADRPGVPFPDPALLETHLVEHLRRQPRPVIGELLWVTEGAVDRGDDTGLAAQIPRRAAMPGHRARGDAHLVARREAAGGSCCRLHHGIVSLAA